MVSKIGYHIHNLMTYRRGYSAEEARHLFDHIQRLQPGALLVLDDIDWARQFKKLVPNCAVVYRSWHPQEAHLFDVMTPRQFYDQYARYGEGGLIINVLNEPNGYGDLRKLADWCAQVCELFGNAGVACAPPAFGEGHPDTNRLHELDALWDALRRWHHLHYYNIHEYGTWRGMLFREGSRWDVFPWRVGRFEQFTVPYLQRKGYPIPRVVITEWGIDSAHDDTGKRGWRTQFNEADYAQQMIAAVEQVYNKPHYVGLCIFSYGNTGVQGSGDDWVTFDVAGALDLHARLERYAGAATPAPAQPVSGPQTPPADPKAAQPASPTIAPIGVRPAEETAPSGASAKAQPLIAGAAAADLGALMSDDDIRVMATAFRAAAKSGVFAPAVAEGFVRFAEVLERYHAARGGG